MQLEQLHVFQPSTKVKGARPPLRVRGGPAGLHIFDRSTGVNVLVDEARVPRHSWSRTPRNVSIALTNACDLHCPYCYAPKNIAVLDIPSLYQWLGELDANGCLGIGFGGGEPTLSPHLPALCQYVTRSTSMAVTLTTHGHRFNDKLAEELIGNVHFIRVSMDGIGRTYELLRGRSFKALLNRIRNVRSVAPFGINFVVNAQTYPDIDMALIIAEDLGAVEFLLLPEQSVRGSDGIDSRTTELLRNWVASYKGSIRLSVSEAGAAGLPTCDPLVMEKGLRAYAHIDASGNLRRSSYDQFGVPIGPAGVLVAIETLETRRRSEHQ